MTLSTVVATVLTLLALAAPATSQVITNNEYSVTVTEKRGDTFHVVGSIVHPRAATRMHASLTIPFGGVLLHVFNTDGKQTQITVSGSRHRPGLPIHVFVPLPNFGLAIEPVDGAVGWTLTVEGFDAAAGSTHP